MSMFIDSSSRNHCGPAHCGRRFAESGRGIAISSVAGFAALVCGWLLAGPSCDAAERWTSLNGSNTVEAEFIGLWGNKVVLELPGPRRVSVDMDDLIAESRIQARRLAEEQQRRRAERQEQILADAKEAAAPAPSPLPEPPPAPAYQPAPAGSGLLAQVEWLEQQEKNGHGLIAWFDMMPPSYQDDLQRLIRSAVAKLDQQGTDQLLGAIHSVGEMIVTRQRWLFSHPRFGAMDATSKKTVESVVLAIGGLIRDGVDPQQLKIDELATRPLRAWLLDLDARLAPHIVALLDQREMLGISPPAFVVQEANDGKATLTINSGDVSNQFAFVNIEGKWWFEEWNAENWAAMVKATEESLANVPEGSLVSGAIAQVAQLTIGSQVQPALNAQSAREFHAAMDSWFAAVGPAIAQVGNFNLAGTRGSRNDPYGESEGFGDDYEMEEEMDEGMMEDEMMDEGMMDEGDLR